jgi:hypothetical protein
MSNRSLGSVVSLYDIRDVEKFCRSALNQLPNGMFLQPDEYEDELQECFERLYRIASRYDPTRTSSFEQFARYQLVEFYVRGDLPRKLLGRTGRRIAERQHSELDERSESGRRPWESFSPESGGLRSDLDAGLDGDEAERDRRLAGARAVLGL